MDINTPLVGSVATGFGQNIEAIPHYNDDKQLKEACKDFVSVLFSQMFSAMRGNPDDENQEDGVSGSLFGGENMYMFMGFLDQEMGKKFTEQGGNDLVNTMYHQLKGDQSFNKNKEV